MSLPYELSNYAVVVADTAVLYPIPFPSRVDLDKIVITSTAATADVNLFSRQTVSTTDALDRIIEGVGGKTLLIPTAPFPVNVGDPLTVAANSVVGYNTTHRVLDTSDDYRQILTDQSFSAAGDGGTVVYAFSTAEREHFRVLATLPVTSNLLALHIDEGVPFVNQDPKSNLRSTTRRLIYLQASVTGTYRVTLSCSSPESQA